MKLRNRKTGEIREFGYLQSDYVKNLVLTVDNDKDSVEMFAYDSLAELNDEWEDYNQKESLIRDDKTKKAFIKYLDNHGYERFLQAVRNFAKLYLGDDFSFIYASKKPLEDYVQNYDYFYDTYYIECDWIKELENEINEN